jgi:hypothetical protein
MKRFLRIVTEVATLSACLALAVGGMYSLEGYSARPGAMVAVDANRCSDPREEPCGPFRLTMFVHARCPCTRTSLIELRRIVDRSPAELRVEVVSVEPVSASPEWRNAATLVEAATIPGVAIRYVSSPIEPVSCGALTSGHVVLDDAAGREMFRGGITRGRGHEGPSEGSRAVLAILAGDSRAMRQHPVFGCPLFSDAAAALAVEQMSQPASAEATDSEVP